MPELAKYTIFHDTDAGEWVLKHDGAERALKREPTKQAIIEFAADRFGDQNPASVKIQKQDGTLEEERTYPRSMDPRKSKG